MPESVSGPVGVPPRGDSEQGIRDTLARLEAKIDRLAEQMADAEAEAEEIMRRATAPAVAKHTAPKRPRRAETTTDRWLRAVKVMAIVAACLVAVLAAMAPVRSHRERFSPACNVLCSRPVAHHSRSANPR